MRLFTFPEAAEHCCVNVKTLRKHAKEGTLATVLTPLGVRVSEESLFPYLEAKIGRQEPEETTVDQCAPGQAAPAETTMHHDEPSGSLTAPTRTTIDQAAPDHRAPVCTTTDHRAPSDATSMDQLAPRQTTRDQQEPVQVRPVGTKMDQHEPESTRLDQGAVPLEAHLAALKLIESALEKAERAEAKAEEHRNNAELAERRRFALEMQLRQYQLALADQSESLAEACALKQAVELQLDSLRATVSLPQPGETPTELPFRVTTSKPSFGRRFKRWLGFSEAV